MLVVEGYMDVVALAQYGVDYAVATLGTATTPTMCKNFCARLTMCSIVLMGTPRVSAPRGARWKQPGSAGGWQGAALLFLPSEHDPDSYVREFGRDAFEQALTRDSLPLSAYLVNELTRRVDMQSQEGRAELVKLATPCWPRWAPPL